MYAQDNYYKNIISNTIYNVGIYLRLSKEDESNVQSESIINQKEYLTKYVLEQGWNLKDIYIDDGYTGTNFNRPDFKRLIKDIESKKINLVITKDMSRLGRDYIETGYYLERYFPENNIRYIAVNDGIDTFENNSNNDMSPFKSVMNDMYAKDISKKVRTALNTKKEKGDFVGSFVPYGYKKDPINKSKLIIDEVTAGTVKRIFDMYIKGDSLCKIARKLNEEDIPSPGAYKMSISNFRRPKSMKLWVDCTIKDIIKNPTYTGCITQNKCAKISYKVKKLKRLPKELWIIVEDTHEPIIDKESFNLAQEIMAKKANQTAKEGKKHLLSSLMYCGDCGERITFTHGNKGLTYTICSKYKRFRTCTRHSIKEDYLEKYVLNDLRRISERVLNKDEFINQAKSSTKKPTYQGTDDEINKIEKRATEIKKIIQGLYEDKIKGLLDEENFLEFLQGYNKEKEQLMLKFEKLEKEKKANEHKNDDDTELLKLVENFVNFEKPSKVVLMKLIDKIIINDDKSIQICYNFSNPF